MTENKNGDQRRLSGPAPVPVEPTAATLGLSPPDGDAPRGATRSAESLAQDLTQLGVDAQLASDLVWRISRLDQFLSPRPMPVSAERDRVGRARAPEPKVLPPAEAPEQPDEQPAKENTREQAVPGSLDAPGVDD